jgi:hypothetical protein
MNFTQLYISLITVLSLTSCISSNSINLKDTSTPEESEISTLEKYKMIEFASIVHIDSQQRIATIRSDKPLLKGYYLTNSRINGIESSVLKLYDTSYESVFIADILEGLPKISDSISLVSDERVAELGLNYTEATID